MGLTIELTVDEQRVLVLFREFEAIRTGHYRLRSRLHSDVYVEKERILRDTKEVSRLTDALAIELCHRHVEADAVLGPGNSGSKLSYALAYNYGVRASRTVLSLDAHRVEFSVVGSTAGFNKPATDVEFGIRPAYAEALRGKRVILIEDVVTLGGTLQRLETLAIRCHAKPVAAVCMVNRGGLDTLEEIPERLALTRIANNLWCDPHDPIEGFDPCPLCEEEIPINTDLGHDAEFLAK